MFASLGIGVYTFHSKIWPSNKVQTEVKPLVADSEHDVVVLEECDLAVKFNKIKFKAKKEENILSFSNDESAKASLDAAKIGCTQLPVSDLFIDLSKDKGRDFGDDPNQTFNGLEKFKKVEICRCFGPLTSYNLRLESYNNKQIFISKSYFLSDFFSSGSVFQIQPNSLAPSTPSVKFE